MGHSPGTLEPGLMREVLTVRHNITSNIQLRRISLW
jgi:hypothetical protein